MPDDVLISGGDIRSADAAADNYDEILRRDTDNAYILIILCDLRLITNLLH